MTPNTLGATAAMIVACLAGSAVPSFSAVVPRDSNARLMVAAAQTTAPDFVGLGNWFNSAPLKLADLRGKVVLVNFWTHGCVNCVNALPHVTERSEERRVGKECRL